MSHLELFRIVLCIIAGLAGAAAVACAIGSTGGDNNNARAIAGLLLLPAIALGAIALAFVVLAWRL